MSGFDDEIDDEEDLDDLEEGESDLENLIEIVSKSKIPSKCEITKDLLVANPEKFKELKRIVLEQLRHYRITRKKNIQIMRFIVKFNIFIGRE